VPPDYAVIPAAPEHLGTLPAIELAAAARFRGWSVPPAVFTEATPLSVFESAQALGHLWVAVSPDGDALGFGVVEPCGPRLHLQELDVLPEHSGRGIGTAIVSEIERWAAGHQFTELTLTTYRDVPWNGPFYIRLGFVLVADANLDAELSSRLEAEAAGGMGTMPRVALRKQVRRLTSA
jgi:GNAT superfamily N-acetyltransferase